MIFDTFVSPIVNSLEKTMKERTITTELGIVGINNQGFLSTRVHLRSVGFYDFRP